MEGMQQCSVNLLKNSMTVSYDEAKLDSGKIVHQVEDIGYALRFTRHRAAKRQEHQAEEKTVQQMRLRRQQSR